MKKKIICLLAFLLIGFYAFAVEGTYKGIEYDIDYINKFDSADDAIVQIVIGVNSFKAQYNGKINIDQYKKPLKDEEDALNAALLNFNIKTGEVYTFLMSIPSNEYMIYGYVYINNEKTISPVYYKMTQIN